MDDPFGAQAFTRQRFLIRYGCSARTKKIEEAEVLAMRCKKTLLFVTGEFERSLLHYALGQFFARTHQWDHALAAWQEAPPDSGIARNVLSGIRRSTSGPSI